MCDQTSEKVDALEAKFRGDNFLSLFSLAFFGSSLLGLFETSFSSMSDTFTETTKKDMKGCHSWTKFKKYKGRKSTDERHPQKYRIPLGTRNDFEEVFQCFFVPLWWCLTSVKKCFQKAL